MRNTDRKFKVVRGKIPLDTGDTIDRWFIVENDLPVFQINEWLEGKSKRKLTTGKKYAYSIEKYLNYLDVKKKTYLQAKKKDVVTFIDYLIFGITSDLSYANISGQVSYSTISGYVTAITEFYRWLEDDNEDDTDTNMKFEKKKDYFNAKNRYIYGQIWGFNYSTIIDDRIKRMKPSREYIKWYTNKETQAIASNFLTLRDRVVFLISIEGGMRIDEILSIRLFDYDRDELSVKPYRSKGKNDGYGRSIVLTETLCKEIDNYILNERAKAESESGQIDDALFINIRKGEHQGEELKYGSYIQILKSCAKRSGIDPDKIRTHSGRSTKTMELLLHQSEYPEDNITDEMIRQIMGWESPSSINPYKNHQDIRLAKLAAAKIHRRKNNSSEEKE